VKKNILRKNLFNINTSNNLNTNIDLIKTTNINILLNRVKLDQKKIFRKKILFVSLLASMIGCVLIFISI